MLSPRRVKFRKRHTGRMKGTASRGTRISFGDYALVATECGWLTARQIEAARITATRHMKRQGKMYIRIFPTSPSPRSRSRPGWVRQGFAGQWVAVVKPGRVLYELEGIPEEIARGAFELRGTSSRSKPSSSSAVSCMNALEIREKTDAEPELVETRRDELFRLKMKLYTGQLEKQQELAVRDIARIHTILRVG